MENFVELTQEEKTITGGSFILGPIIFDAFAFYRNAVRGFTDGLAAAVR